MQNGRDPLLTVKYFVQRYIGKVITFLRKFPPPKARAIRVKEIAFAIDRLLSEESTGNSGLSQEEPKEISIAVSATLLGVFSGSGKAVSV